MAFGVKNEGEYITPVTAPISKLWRQILPVERSVVFAKIVVVFPRSAQFAFLILKFWVGEEWKILAGNDQFYCC